MHEPLTFSANVAEDLVSISGETAAPQAPPKLIVCDYNLLAEKEFIEKLKAENPAHLQAIMSRGEELVAAIEARDLTRFGELLRAEYFFWHVIKAWKTAVLDAYVEGLRWMLENGMRATHEAIRGTISNAVNDLTSAEALAITDLLLQYGVSINDNCEATEYRTALHLACMQEDLDLVRELIARGADVNAIDKTGKMPLNYVETETNRVAQEICTVLREAGAESDWRTPLRDRFEA
jgi:hypothetical protein